MPSRIRRLTRPLAVAILTLAATGCDRKPPGPSAGAAPEGQPAPTNRVDINPAVRQNLGITFAKVERRNVAATLRIPGRFELTPTARREYRVPAHGRIELLVEQYQTVDAGTPLYRLDSSRWRELQRELTDAHAAVILAQAGVDSIGPFVEAHEKHHAEIENAVSLWTQRVASLELLQAAGGARGDEIAQAKVSLATAKVDLAETLEKEAELSARRRDVHAQLDAARSRVAILLESAASLTLIPADDLAAERAGKPRWQTIGQIEVSALAPGVVESIGSTSGSFIEQDTPVLTTVQPTLVRFRAHALQSDLGRLADGLPATVVTPRGGSLASDQRVPGILTLAPSADPHRRTIELVMTPTPGAPLPPWARAGVSAFLEVVVRGEPDRSELAIPLACVARDGTQSIIFRRDPADPTKAIRMEADLGIDDGRWVVIQSGVAEGNEVVLDGVYQLMVATSGSITKGGHFHADGTFHEGQD
ncbi:MAG: efflux RND transporter periplasmic adaptor subunit [Phycisphaerales bacterium]